MRFFTTHQCRKIFVIPCRIIVHISVDTHFQSRFFRLKGHMTPVRQCDFNGRTGMVFPVFQNTLHTLNIGTKRTPAVGKPFCNHIFPIQTGIKSRACIFVCKKGNGIISRMGFKHQPFDTALFRINQFPVLLFNDAALGDKRK